jgi:hypothetical protein
MSGGCFYIIETPFWIIMSIIFFVAVHLTENLRKPVGVSYIADQFKEDILATVLSAESQVKSLCMPHLLHLLSGLWLTVSD